VRVSRLGVLGIAVAVFVVISLLLSAVYCTYPWKEPPRF
jgi:hypothetical protein